MVSAVPRVYQWVKCDILSQNTTEPEWDHFNPMSNGQTHKERESTNNYLDSAYYIQQNAARFCAVPLQSPSSKIKTSQQTVQITTGILMSPVLTVNSEKNIKGGNSQSKEKSFGKAEHGREFHLLTQMLLNLLVYFWNFRKLITGKTHLPVFC